ncbi:MAG: tetratricopeptide repeat protein, partial [Myxococcota bacterium]
PADRLAGPVSPSDRQVATAPMPAPIPGRPLPQNDERPTELNRAPTAIPVPLAESNAPSYRAATAIDPPPGPRRGRRFGMFFAVLLLAAAVFATVVVLFEVIGPMPDPDEELARLFNEERYAEVIELYERDPTAFGEVEQAEGYYRAAGTLSTEAEMPLDVDDPDNGFDPEEDEAAAAIAPPPPETESPTPEPSPPPSAPPPAAPPTPEPPITEPARPKAASPEAIAARRRRRAEAVARQAQRRLQQVRRLVEQGKRLVIEGKFEEAEDTLKACLRMDPQQPACHRNLGVLYAKQDRTTSAIRHYRRYIELRPDAGDAPRVREILKKFEDSP